MSWYSMISHVICHGITWHNIDVSLFYVSPSTSVTNTPLKETIHMVSNKVFEHKKKVDGLSKTDFRRLLTLATEGTVFYFNGQYYRQKDRVAMGSPWDLRWPTRSSAIMK